jgi:basic amino acid/polyamine antiporter, APA family
MLIGLDIYLVYGAKNSHLGNGTSSRKGMKMARYTGIALAVLLAIVGFLYQISVGWTHPVLNPDKTPLLNADGSSVMENTDRTLLYISIVIAIIHAALYASKLGRKEDKA